MKVFYPLPDTKSINTTHQSSKEGNMLKTAASTKDAPKPTPPKFILQKGKFWEQYNKTPYANRNNLILSWVKAGLVPAPTLVKVTVQNPKDPSIKTTYEVMPQVFTIEGKPVVLSAEMAQIIGKHFKLDLPTREVLTQIYEKAKHITPGGKPGMKRLGLESEKLSQYSDEVAAALKRLNLKPEDIVAGQHKEIFRPLKGLEGKLHAAGWVAAPPPAPKDPSNKKAVEEYQKKLKEWEDKVRRFDPSVIIQSYRGATGHDTYHEEYPQANRYMGKVYVNVTGTEEALTVKELEEKAQKDPRYKKHLENITGGRSYGNYDKPSATSNKPVAKLNVKPTTKPAPTTTPSPEEKAIEDVITSFADTIHQRRIKVAQRVFALKTL